MTEKEQAKFDEMHQEHFDSLVYWGLDYINYNPALRNDVEDWAQEAFKRAVKDKDKFLSSDSQIGWLIVACKHVADNALQRKKVRDDRHGISIDDPNGPSVEDVRAGFDRWAAKKEADTILTKVSKILTDNEHNVYEKNFLEGLSEQEVAEELGKPLSAVKAAKRRIRGKAKKVREYENS